MNQPEETTIQVSVLKALTLSSASMLVFAIGLFAIGVPMDDHLLVGFLLILLPVMTIAFAVAFRLMFCCRIGPEGLRSAVPWGYTKVLRWNDISYIRASWPFYVVRGRNITDLCVLPCKFLLKQPELLEQSIGTHAPENNILRETFGITFASK